jgi:hypothetical protein
MKACCPECGLVGPLAVFLEHADNKRAVAAALRIPSELTMGMLRYLSYFSPPAKALAAAKEARLLETLADAIAAGAVTRKGVVWTAPRELWRLALDTLAASPPAALPLTDHHYLFQVVANLAQKVAAKDERADEEARKHARQFEPQSGQPAAVAQVLAQVGFAAPVPTPSSTFEQRRGAALRHIEAARLAAQGKPIQDDDHP